MGIDPKILMAMDYFEAMYYISESYKARKEDRRNQIILIYNAVMWNRIEPKYIPTLESIIGTTGVDSEVGKSVQSVEEQEEVLRSLGKKFRKEGR